MKALFAIMLVACTEPAPGLLAVELTTDFDGVRAARTQLLDEAGAPIAEQTIAIVGTDDLNAPFRIAEIPVSATGRHEVTVSLLDANGDEIVERTLPILLGGANVVLFTILRSCEDVECTGETAYCDDGVCVVPLCTEGAPCFDGPASSASVGSCRPGMQHCIDPLTQMACEGETLPSEDLANDADDDCDDRIDEEAVLEGSGSSVASDHESIAVAFTERRMDIVTPISHVYVRRFTWAGDGEPRDPVRISGAEGGYAPSIAYADGRYLVSYEVRADPFATDRALEWVELDAHTLEVIARARIADTVCAASPIVVLPDGRAVRSIVDETRAVQLLYIAPDGTVSTEIVSAGPSFCVTALARHHARDELLVHWQDAGVIRPGPNTGHFQRTSFDGTASSRERTAPVGQQVLLTSQGDGWVAAYRLLVFFEANAQSTTFGALFLDAVGSAIEDLQLAPAGITEVEDTLQSVATDRAGRATLIATSGSGTHAFTLERPAITRRVQLVGYGRSGGAGFIDDGVELAVAVDAFDGVRARVYLTSVTDRTPRLAPIEVSFH